MSFLRYLYLKSHQERYHQKEKTLLINEGEWSSGLRRCD